MTTTNNESSTNTMGMARRLSAVLVECVKEHPGHKRGFYVEKLKEMAEIILNGNTWPSLERLFDHAFQVARKSKYIRFDNGLWYANEVPICPCCKRPWVESIVEKKSATGDGDGNGDH